MHSGFREQTMQLSRQEVKVTNQLKEEGIDKKRIRKREILGKNMAVERRICRNDRGTA